ncbi:MAG TPA: hypothetical protein PLG34_01700 [Spirochaetota bacterium]|jgi:hypothetical protein|nr:MAG: hypothetical protein BWX91_00929 [Spirochaetes bacterium ADurb.Bin133]HPY86683.1 hypothetical protein [Spirochaetota bacterium]HQB60721.1 hypothetical protein [Spirochaetota bacterium]
MKRALGLILFLFAVNLFSSEIDIAKLKIRRAYDSYRAGKNALAEDVLKGANEFALNIPEYFYLKNELLGDSRDVLYIKMENSRNIIKNIKNNYFLSAYEILNHVKDISLKTRDYDYAKKVYKEILSIPNIDLLNDYIGYIETVFLSKDLSDIENILKEARNRYNSIEFEYFDLKSKIILNKIDSNEFQRKISVLNANGYSKSKILLLSVLRSPANGIKKCLDDYFSLKASKSLDGYYQREILYNLIMKSSSLKTPDVLSALQEWSEINGQRYAETFDILKNRNLYSIISKNAALSENILKYSGERIEDADNDGNWEELYVITSGDVRSRVVDKNQDGAYEYKYTYFEDGKIETFTVYEGRNSDYKEARFNPYDSSVVTIDIYNSGKLTEKITAVKSALYLNVDILKNIDEKIYRNYIDKKETFGDFYSISRYTDGQINRRDIDLDYDGAIEEKEFYKNGVIYEKLKDADKDGSFEIIERYANGKLKTVFCKESDFSDYYYYREDIEPNYSVKNWDTNLDGIYESSVTEYPNGTSYNKLDIDYDGVYDYQVELKNGEPVRLSKIESGKLINIKTFSSKEEIKKNNWYIVSYRDIKKVDVPDKIVFTDGKKTSGYFLDKNEKYYFENSDIINDNLNFKLFVIDSEIYLIDNRE